MFDAVYYLAVFTLMGINLGLLFFLVVWEKKNRSPLIVVPIMLIAVYWFPMLLAFFFDGFSNYTYFIAVAWGFMYVFFYFLFRYFLYLYLIKKHIYLDFETQRVTMFPFYFGVLFVLVSFALIVKLHLTSGFVTWEAMRGWNPIEKNMHNYLMYFSSGLGLYFFVTRKYILLFLLFLYFLASSFLLMSRGYLVAFFLPILFYIFISERFNAVRSFKYFGFAALFVFLYVFSRMLRHAGGITAYIAEPSFSIPDFGEFQLVSAYLYMVDSYLASIDFIGFGDNVSLLKLLQVITKPIYFIGFDGLPSIPSDRLVWDAYVGVLDVNGSYHPTAIGLAFFDSPLFGFLIYPFFAVFVMLCFEKVSLRFHGLYYFNFSVLVIVSSMFVRGAFHGAFMILLVFLFLMPALILSGRILRLAEKK